MTPSLLQLPQHDPPSDDWFDQWEASFAHQYGDRLKPVIHRLFRWARKGAAAECDAVKAAKAELSQMLRDMADDVDAQLKG